MKPLETATLVAATIATGLMAGLFTSFAYAVMPGLRETDDRTFVETMQRINVAILNGWFLLSFLGALVCTALATFLRVRGGGGPVLPWLVAGLVLYGAMLVITIAVNVPLNNQLAAAGPPDAMADLAAVRRQFEAKWVAWNVARAGTATVAFGSLTWALVRHGRTAG